jgi:very-short-patch-repair endonuclease
MLGNTHPLGHFCSAETKEKMAIARAKALSEGKYPRANTKLHKKLKELLFSKNVETRSEVRFGKYCVDEYDPIRHIAYEADGSYWHNEEEDRRRDAYLKREFNLKVVRFTEKQLLGVIL